MGAHFEIARSAKQAEIMRHVLEGMDRGKPLTFRELHSRLSYGDECSLGAVKMSIRHLKKWKMVSTEKGEKSRTIIKATSLGYATFRRTPVML